MNTETEMRFTSDEGIVIGNYSGGTIVAGHVLGKRLGESELEMLYHGATTSGEVQAGKAHARLARDKENQMRMYLDWQWLTGDQSKGQRENGNLILVSEVRCQDNGVTVTSVLWERIK